MAISRRDALKSIAVLAATPWHARAAAAPRRLTAAATRQQIVPAAYPRTSVWSYDGVVPAPELRYRQGDTLRIVVANRLPQPTTVHWHGVRVPNRMDGVPGLTQPPIDPDGEFLYEFPLPDAGTYWFHPHLGRDEQVARGLYGALIVEERVPLEVDRDLTWMLSDMRLNSDASQREDFGSLFDLTHGGRIGNTVTLNGRFTAKDGVFEVRSGERIRLRLVNAAVARIFLLRFSGFDPRVVALDGHAVEPHAPERGLVELGPGMRADLVLDCTGAPGTGVAVTDEYDPRGGTNLTRIVYRDEAPLVPPRGGRPAALAANVLPEPDLARAVRHRIVFEGGAMGALREAEHEGERMPLAALVRQHRLAWTVNGIAVKEHAHDPLLTLKRGGHYVLEMANRTAWPHPIHLHGHVFRVIGRNGKATQYREWRDTVLMAPREAVDIAFVADNPGDWMFHCHILAHQAAGMMAVLRVE